MDVINDRNRHWGVSAWGQFAFTHFPDGRRYAAFLTGFFRPETLTVDQLGRLAQDALYYHEGPTAATPQELPRYAHQMSVPAGIRKAGPWQLCLSGLMSTQAINSQFYLDRQGHISVFHQRLGLIITGANSKRQPELATFSEKLPGQTVHMPISTRLQMSDAQDRLSLALQHVLQRSLRAGAFGARIDPALCDHGPGTAGRRPAFDVAIVFEGGRDARDWRGQEDCVGIGTNRT